MSICRQWRFFSLLPLVFHLETAVSKARKLLCPSVYLTHPWQRDCSLSSHEYGNCLILQLFLLSQPEGPSFPQLIPETTDFPLSLLSLSSKSLFLIYLMLVTALVTQVSPGPSLRRAGIVDKATDPSSPVQFLELPTLCCYNLTVGCFENKCCMALCSGSESWAVGWQQ